MTIASADPRAAELLSQYRPEDASFLASPAGTMLAEGVYCPVPPSGRAEGLADLPLRVDAVLRVAEAAGHDVRTVVGAVPFAPDADARLVVPARLLRGEPLPPYAGPPRVAPRVPDWGWGGDPQFTGAVERAVRHIRAGRYDKVVLARSVRVTVPGFEPAAVVRALAGRDGRAYTFGVGLGGGRTLLGASPELLVSRRGRTVTANPLAGSAARSADPAEDERRAAALLRSAKDRHEHALVRDAVAEALRPFCRTLDVPEEPVLTRTPAMWHLSTTVTGEVADPAISSLALAVALHPTPAVCGTPTPAARSAIAELEPFDRGFYTGMVGWTDADGDGEWAVTIRCAVADGEGLDLFAGAGIVADSDPEAETAETTAKLGTVLAALGLSDVA